MGRTITPVVKYLLIINVGLLLIENLLHINLSYLFGFRNIGSEYFQPFQIVTYMFLHAGFSHLIFNMLGLFFLGPLLEQVFGSKKFLIYYMVTGIGAGLLYAGVDYAETYQIRQDVNIYLNNPSPQALLEYTDKHYPYLIGKELELVQEKYPSDPDNINFIKQAQRLVLEIYRSKTAGVMVGASGAIFGIIIAFGLLFPNLELMLLIPPIPIKAKYLALFYGIYSVYSLMQNVQGDNVAHLAHIGGMLFGYIMIRYWNLKPYM